MAHVPISLVGGGGADLDLITVTPADVRKNKVYVDADGNAQNGAMPELPETIYTPSVSDQTIAAGQRLAGTQTIKGDSDLIAANIISGKNIFNVPGNRKYFDVVSNVIYNGNVSYTSYKPSGSKDSYKGQGVSCWAPYSSYNSVVLRIYQDTSGAGAEADVVLRKGNVRKAAVIVTKYIGQAYETVWMEIWRESNGEIWFYPFRGNVNGTYHTVIEVLGVSSADISKDNEWG